MSETEGGSSIMRRQFMSGLAGLALGGTLGAVPAAASAERGRNAFRALPKAAWVRKIGPSDLARIRAFVRTERIGTVLLSISGPLADGLKGKNRPLLNELEGFRRDGVSLYALAGDLSWPGMERLPDFLGMLIDVMHSNGRLFEGLSLDVEPDALAGWHNPEERIGLIDGTAAFFETVRRGLGTFKLDIAVNPAFADMKTSKGESFLAAIARSADSIELMAYRNSPVRTIHWAEKAIRTASDAGRDWRLGVLVHRNRERGTSYFGRDAGAFLADMIALDRLSHRLNGGGTYRGLVFEDYHGLRRMLT